MGIVVVVYGSRHICGTSFQRATLDPHHHAKSLQTCHSSPSIEAPMMLQQNKQRPFHPTNLWAKQKILSPLDYNPFERPIPFCVHQSSRQA